MGNKKRTEEEVEEEVIIDALSHLINGKKLLKFTINSNFLNKLALKLFDDLNHHHISPSKCAHAMCLSSSHGYYELVEILAKRSKMNSIKPIHSMNHYQERLKHGLKQKENQIVNYNYVVINVLNC